jgi:transposase
MKIKNAKSIGVEELHERRKQAVALHKKGMRNVQIAPIVGAHRNTVGEWVAAYKTGGAKALRPEKPGRPSGSGRRLSAEQEQDVRRAIADKCPDQLKMPFALWTRNAVALYIRQRHGIAVPIRTVGWYLRRWGFTPQKPLKRFYERNEAAVRRWIAEEYPAIKARARKEKAEIHWGDETGIRSGDHRARGYAPKGETPVCRVKGTAEKVNMISSVTNRGKVRFMLYRGTMNAKTMTAFCARLVESSGRRKVFLIVDNLRTHHCKPVREWLAKRPKRIEVFYLPSYAPDLNPGEYLNCDMKRTLGESPDARAKGTLARNALRVMRGIQKRPERVRKYFEHKSIAYAV